MAQKQANSTKKLTPLGIVAAFVTLTELALGTAVTQTTGTVQVILTLFVVLFPVLTLTAFFVTLWHRPFVFYDPGAYGGEVDAKSFMETMQRCCGPQPQNVPPEQPGTTGVSRV
jgi:hypothetical protein